MSQQSVQTPPDLEGAITVAAMARREALLRTARGEGIYPSEWLFALVAVLAVATIFLNGNFLGSYRPAFWAVIASTAIAQAFAVRSARQIKALYELLEDTRSPSGARL